MSARITSADLARLQGGKDKTTKRHKYGVAAPEERTYRGYCYASKAERIYAESLVMLQDSGHIVGFADHPQVMLGEDLRFKPDFIVIEPGGNVYYVDVKGKETREWLRIKKLWPKYQNVPLHVVKLDYRKGTFATVEIVGGER